MIYVHRDQTIIPEKVLKVAERAQKHLETLTSVDERREYIKKKSHIWRAFGRYLAQMSHEKCWYSESPDPHSFFDVDHYRPKLEAKRTEEQTDTPGYEWLAFSWENFRYAANCANRLLTNHETGVVEGKGSWFPLLPDSIVASWDDRCVDKEKPILLDPVDRRDVRLVDIADDGMVVPSKFAVGSDKLRVTTSVKMYGLNLPRIKAARMRLMRKVKSDIETALETLEAVQKPDVTDDFADSIPTERHWESLTEYTLPTQPFSAAARHVLISQGLAELCAQPEDLPRACAIET
jgi:hypothetical protein